MFGFWAIVAIFIVASLAFLLPPLLRKNSKSEIVARKDLTVAVYQDQFDELDNDLKNNVISQEQYDQAKIDLEKNLLEDIGKANQADENIEKASLTGNKITAVIILAVVPVLSLSLYDRWGAGVGGIDPESVPQQVKNEQHQETIQGMISGLQEKLAQNPEDGEGWFMLARSYVFLKRYDDAVAAYERTMPLGGNQSADVLASYADAIAMASNRELTDKAVNVLKQAIQLDPGHVKSLWLVGTAEYQKKNYPDALKYWERLYAVLEPGSEDAVQISKNIGELRSILGMPPMATASTPAMQQAPMEALSDVRVQGSVSLSQDISENAAPDDTVFVFARAATGPRMPLAIIRKQVKDMPFDFTLDDSLAMNPSMRISSVPNVIVGARVSKTGNAMPQPGDLEGMSGVIAVGSSGSINLEINRVIQ